MKSRSGCCTLLFLFGLIGSPVIAEEMKYPLTVTVSGAKPGTGQAVLFDRQGETFRAEWGERREGFILVYGDIGSPDTLHHAGIHEAKILVCTIPDAFLKGTSNAKLVRQHSDGCARQKLSGILPEIVALSGVSS